MGKKNRKKARNRQPAPANASESAPSTSEPAAVVEEQREVEEGSDGDVEMEEQSSGMSGRSTPAEESSEPESEQTKGPPKTRAPKKSLTQKVYGLLPAFKAAKLSPFDVILEILDEDNYQFDDYRKELYKPSSTKLSRILSQIANSQGGRQKLSEWFQEDDGTACIGETIAEEMDNMRKAYTLTGLVDVSPEYIRNREDDNFTKDAPFAMKLLRAAAQTKRQERENVKKTPDDVCDSIMRQLLYQRSNRCLGFQAEFGLFLWATGASRATIDACHRMGLSVSYQSVLNLLKKLAEGCMALAVAAAMTFYAFCYDNINISTSIFVEQRGTLATPGKVTSGTLGIVYPLPNATPEAMDLAPILTNMRNPSYRGLSFDNDLIPTKEALTSIVHQFRVHIVCALAKFTKGLDLKSYGDYILQHKPRRQLPQGQRTKFYPIRVSTTEEASVGGNLKFNKEAHLDMLKGDQEKLSKYAIPSINDQMTNARIRSGQFLRIDDLNDFQRCLVYQLAMGLFHAALNLAWELLQAHRGTAQQVGTLAFWIVVLEKKRMASAKPDYHTLYAMLTQVLEGLLLSAWMEVCMHEHPTFDANAKAKASYKQKKDALFAYTKSKPTAADLSAKASTILNDYVTPLPSVHADALSDDDTEDEGEDTTRTPASKIPPPVPTGIDEDPAKDPANQNVRLLMRDVLYLLELVTAVKDGDFGRVEDILPHLAMIYRGGGSNNYCHEVLFLIQNLKHIWPGDFADIMRDIMIVNPSGIPGHCLATDINMEYTIREIKELIVAKGCENTWDHLGDISAAIDYIKEVKRRMAVILNLPHQNKGHSDADISHLVWRVADRAQKDKLVVHQRSRAGYTKVKAMPNLMENGARLLKSGTLTTFNAKFKNYVNGLGYTPEEDEIPLADLSIFSEDNDGPVQAQEADEDW